MARRLATEYVKASLQLTEAQLTRFVQSLAKQSIVGRVKVLENGNQEVVLEDGQGDEIIFLFEKQGNRYVCVTSCRLVHPKLTQVMHKLVATFRGEAVVNRIFAGFTITYYYVDGAVRKIVEQKEEPRVIFEHKDTVLDLQNMYRNDRVEIRIASIKERINSLLDKRNHNLSAEEIQAVDHELAEMAKQLFILEA
ncbi:non-ribosomal peptide synthetase module [Paenibacillus alvei]|uniref:Non-ribosomal peptide synthetase module n=1 Tax=Paenibacillus alvei TaxID=44250 RepID=A0AAP7DJI0_PAEAL|nr:non-ribosomal peptide synthetase module [Paenibacillus alvei]MBG9734529.1 non-ribosomal peptide synthetase module [Paenibacillus alvei]MBG9743160.1 non-ribosomal peptide synthetase module [Paenibacillus alvei]MCY9579527.1 non-ribosomal peptide synthetase module [Paenibacillus alvei]MCY9586486.1 non-ribosomal peptide synthetase module [Paenibacillus alvei]MCY9764572.1 non-ribosomal peptide synthetase module [Paenibacillus alvei]